MITPRATRLVRAADLRAFRAAVTTLAVDGAPGQARDRLVIVPTRAAAAHLLRTIEDALDGGACLLPDFVTPGELVERLAERLEDGRVMLTDAEREVLLGVACRAAKDAGAEPPFQLRPGLIAEILAFYDALRRNQKDVDTFARLALGQLEPGASYDRGAERLVRQTRFLAAAFHEFENRCAAAGCDEHGRRRDLLTPASRPIRHVVAAVGDQAFDRNGLTAADWDLLARLPGLERLDVVVTDRTLAGAFHERVHALLPGIEEVRFAAAGDQVVAGADDSERRGPVLVVPDGERRLHEARDREEEVELFARRVKQSVRAGTVSSLDRIALVVRQPLPYVYLAREVLRGGGVPCQLFDALPLAAEPFAAALDLVFSFVSAGFTRGPGVALLRSPHFQFQSDAQEPVSHEDVAALDRALSESGYLGDPDVLARLVAAWRADAAAGGRARHLLRGGAALLEAVDDLRPLRTAAPAAAHLDVLQRFLARRERPAGGDAALRSRQHRARAAILGTLALLRDAYGRFDPQPIGFESVAALVRRWIDGQTFAPRTGDAGVHVVDAASAPFGSFEHVHLAGLVDGEWPDRPRRNIFYSPAILRDLGWPAESGRADWARAAFGDLLGLASRRTVISTFVLEGDSLVSPSPFADEAASMALPLEEEAVPEAGIFDYEALGGEEPDVAALGEPARAWTRFRRDARPDHPPAAGATSPQPPRAWSLSALERYQDCAFKFFAADVLKLEEAPQDEDGLSPRTRGRFIHEVFQQFFAAWDAGAGGTITAERIDEARALFAGVADPLLARLPDADAALERTRLFGSAISTGVVDVVLGLEASRPADVRERWLEHRMEGDFTLGDPSGRRVSLKGVADRIDLLDGRRLRVIDYKTGSAPDPRRALQVPIYALCASELLNRRDGGTWDVEDAAYVAFTGKRTLVAVTKPSAGGSETAAVLAAARERLFDVVDGIARGEFPPQPHDPAICRYCAYAAVCRKDYAGDD